jgi:hypothetical protein
MHAVVWAALHRALEADGGSASAHDVIERVRSMDPETARWPLRIELILENLAIDPRTPVVSRRSMADGAPVYELRRTPVGGA